MVVLVAYNYRSSKLYFPEIGPSPDDPAKTRRQLSKWQFEWYQCYGDLDICFWSFCCPWIRWAHTMDLLHLVEYGPAFGIFFMLEVVNQLTGFVFLGIYFTMLLVYYRQKVRQVFGMQNYGTCAGILEDWLCLCFCMPCTIAQEAQHVKFAADMGFPVPACMAEFAGQRQHLKSPELTAGLLLDDDEGDPDTSSSQEFQDVISKISGSVRNSPANFADIAHHGVWWHLPPHAPHAQQEQQPWHGQQGHQSAAVGSSSRQKPQRQQGHRVGCQRETLAGAQSEQ